jgi:hypothetical protein
METKVLTVDVKTGNATTRIVDIPLEPTVWHYPRPMRVQVPMQLVRENKEKIEFGAVDNEYLSQLLTYMLATDTIQRVIENDTLYAYFDIIFEVHEAILQSVGITVETKP